MLHNLGISPGNNFTSWYHWFGVLVIAKSCAIYVYTQENFYNSHFKINLSQRFS